MDSKIAFLVNFGFAWFLVALAVAGYFLTLKRMGEKWVFWIILAVAWGFFGIAETLLVTGLIVSVSYINTIRLSSFVLVIASLVLLFLKLASLKRAARLPAKNITDNKQS